jgi:hypothetical protein
MALTTTERKRLDDLETTVRQLAVLVQGGGSINQLNRLNVLGQNRIEELTQLVEQLEAETRELLELARKLQ